MQRLRNTFDRLWAALMFFTRLPWWRMHEPQADAFKTVVQYWPIVGWITGGCMALVFGLGVQFCTMPIVALLAIGARILLTGALHEDGLADFCDGMGGGNGRERILQIMKDSHIGTYGVLGLIVYLAFLYFSVRELTLGFLKLSMHTECHNPILMMCAAMLTADVWGKCCASLIINELPYARNEETAKAHVVYTPLQWGWHLLRVVIAMLPVAGLWWYIGIMPHPALFIVPLVVELLLAWWMHKRIDGYTGDCCGATFLLCEASIYLTWIITIC